MLELKNLLSQHVVAGLKKHYELDVQERMNWQKRRKDFEGRRTRVVLAYTTAARKKPLAKARSTMACCSSVPSEPVLPWSPCFLCRRILAK